MDVALLQHLHLLYLLKVKIRKLKFYKTIKIVLAETSKLVDDYNGLLDTYVCQKKKAFARKLFSFVENKKQAHEVINGVNEILLV